MTHRERVQAAFLHRTPDRTPMFEYVLLSPVASALLERSFEDFGGDADAWRAYARAVGYEQALRQYARDRLDMAGMLGHDLLYCVPNPSADSLGLPESAHAEAAKADWVDDDPVERIRARNLRSRAALDAPFDETSLIVYAYLCEEMRRRGIDLPVYAPAFHHGVWTDVDLMQTMLLEPETAHEHFALMTQFSLRLIRNYIRLEIDIIGIGGDFAGNQPLISPASYRAFIAPELRVLSDTIHEHGKWACNASDGNLWGCLEDFLITSGADAYGEVDLQAGMTLRALKQAYGDRITFFGNMDSGNVLSFASEDEIARQTVACIEDGMGLGGHVFTASNAITASIPVKNYIAMVNAYRRYFGLGSVQRS